MQGDGDGPVPALKEWAAIVRALLAGEQIIDLRKGGLREPGRHFGLPAVRCWLFPTVEHQRPELLKPAYRRWAEDTAAAPVTGAPQGAPGRSAGGTPEGTIEIGGWAEIVGVATITDEGALDALDARVVWTRDYVERRFAWKRRDPLWVLALRVHRLLEPRRIPWRDAYRGCASWVNLTDLPCDPVELPSTPAVTDVAFKARLAGLAEALPGGFRPPGPQGPGA